MTDAAQPKEGKSQGIFRRVSLDRLNSPEQLDELMQVVGPKSWISLLTLGGLVVAAVCWSVWGRIPVTVEGRGVLVHPRQVVDLQSPGSGTLERVDITPGQVIAKGDLLGVLDRSLLEHQLDQKRSELERRKKNRLVSGPLYSERVKKERESLQRERVMLRRQIGELHTQADELAKAAKTSLEDRRKSLNEQLELFRDMSRRLNARVKRYEQLEKKGIVSKQDILLLEQTALNTLLTSQTLQTQLQELSVTEIKERDQDMARRHRILELENRLHDVEVKESQLEQTAAEFEHSKQEPLEALEAEVAHLEGQLQEESRILSPYSGRVLQVMATRGQVVEAGSPLAVLEIADEGKPLVSVTCFAIKDGKQVAEGLQVLITPDTVQRQRFGSLLGKVLEVRAFPVNTQEVTKIVGNEEVAKALVPAEGCILVYSELIPDETTPSGYAWSSSTGPALRLTPGTTTSARVVVEQRSPLSFILPILRSTGAE